MRNLIKKIDSSYLNGLIQRSWANLHLSRFRSSTRYKPVRGCDRKIVIHYKKDMTSELSILCDKYGSDKGEIKTSGHPYAWPSTSYADYYSLLFAQKRDCISNVFECGIGTNNPNLPSTMGQHGKPGASLRVWRDYFPQAQIIGADIDGDILFKDDRIETYHVDQTDPASVRKLWDSVSVDSFNIMIDDGLHLYEAGICLFENSIQKLAPNGIWIVEDVPPRDLVMYQNYFANRSYRVEYVNLSRSDTLLIDNNLVVIRR